MNPDKTDAEAEVHEHRAQEFQAKADQELTYAKEKHERANIERERLASREAEKMAIRKAEELSKLKEMESNQ